MQVIHAHIKARQWVNVLYRCGTVIDRMFLDVLFF